VKKNWLGYGLLVLLIAIFVLLWLAMGDLTGAILSLIVLLLGGVLAVAVLSYLITNAPIWFSYLRGVSWDDYLQKLEKTGKALRENYEASRALTVADHTTGRLMHFIDIGGGRILCLYGQQYYEFEPIDDDPDLNQSRQFPTETFSLLRDVKKDEVLALFPGSVVLEPTTCDPIVKPKKLIELGFQLTDGEIVFGSSLEAVEHTLKTAT
jgi:hypothetical protein